MITQAEDTADPQTTRKIRAITKAFDEALDKNDAAAVAALFTEDAVFVTDGGPIYGPYAIEKWYGDVFNAWHLKTHVGKPDGDAPHVIGTAGNEVWETGAWSETGESLTGDPISINGYWSAIDSRDGDAWKIRMLTYNVTPAQAT